MKDLRICRCCNAIYEKPTGFWQEKDIARIYDNLEVKGFCEFCDRNNKNWYISDKPCHKNI